jgi:uncharacterized phiE125 gp8 family phage protein
MYLPDPFLARNPLRVTRNRLLTRTSPPASEPLTLNDTKLYLRLDNTDEDTLVTNLITAARITAENWLRRSLITQSWKIAFDDGIPQSIWLPMGPINAVTGVTVVNIDGTTQVIASNSYWLNAAQNALVMFGELIGFRIEVTYTAGYGDASTVPQPIKLGMLSHIAALYDSRGEDGDVVLPEQAVGLYMPFREVRL